MMVYGSDDENIHYLNCIHAPLFKIKVSYPKFGRQNASLSQTKEKGRPTQLGPKG